MACYWRTITNRTYANFKSQLRCVLNFVEDQRQHETEVTPDESDRAYLEEINRDLRPESTVGDTQSEFAKDVTTVNKRAAAAQTRKFRDVESERPRHRRGE
jgi:hypothetical protein